MNNLLGVDLNEIVSEQVASQLEAQEKEIDRYRELYYDEQRKRAFAEQELSKADLQVSLVKSIQKGYEELKAKPETENEHKKNLAEVRFDYIKRVVSSLSGKPIDFHWIHDGGLQYNLAVGFYDHKGILLPILSLIGADSKMVNEIRAFKMPYDWEKENIMAYVKNPHYCTNGALFGERSRYWVEYGCKITNCPHDLLQRNPAILEEDVFEEVIKTLKSNHPERWHLYAIPKYNQHLSLEQVQQIGECLIGLKQGDFKNDGVEQFTSKWMKSFTESTLEYLFQFISSDNQFRMFHWENFPFEYQQRYLKSRTFQQLLTITGNYSCKWTEKQKEDMYRIWMEENPKAQD